MATPRGPTPLWGRPEAHQRTTQCRRPCRSHRFRDCHQCTGGIYVLRHPPLPGPRSEAMAWQGSCNLLTQTALPMTSMLLLFAHAQTFPSIFRYLFAELNPHANMFHISGRVACMCVCVYAPPVIDTCGQLIYHSVRPNLLHPVPCP